MRRKRGFAALPGWANSPRGLPLYSKPPVPSLTEKLMRDFCVATPSSASSGSKLG